MDTNRNCTIDATVGCCFKRALIICGLLLLCGSSALAENYPEPLNGAWGGRAAYLGDDSAITAEKACRAYHNPSSHEAGGDVLVFQGNEKHSYGGYMDYTDQNVTVVRISPDHWTITDRHYDDGEGGKRSGYKNVKYEAVVDANLLTIKEGKDTSRFNRCDTASERTTVLVIGYPNEGKVDATPDGCSKAVADMTSWKGDDLKQGVMRVCAARTAHVSAYNRLQSDYERFASAISSDGRLNLATSVDQLKIYIKSCMDHQFSTTSGGHNILIDVIPNVIAADCLNRGAELLESDAARLTCQPDKLLGCWH